MTFTACSYSPALLVKFLGKWTATSIAEKIMRLEESIHLFVQEEHITLYIDYRTIEYWMLSKLSIMCMITHHFLLYFI